MSDNVEKFFSEQATRQLNPDERITALKLMEMQRHAMLMYTSCGWFFDELSGIETVQVIQYAARAIQLAGDVFSSDLEGGFLERLDQAPSNIPEHGNGRKVYEKFVKPAMIDWQKVVGHYAISSMFQSYSEKTKIFLYSFEEQKRHYAEAGKSKLAIGTVKVSFDITRKSDTLSYAELYMGEHNCTGAVRKFEKQEEFDAMLNELKAAFDTADFPQTIRLLDRHFGESSFTLKSL